MSSIQEPNPNAIGAPRRPGPEAPAPQKAPVPAEPQPSGDRLAAEHRPEAPAAPGELVARIKAMQAPQSSVQSEPQPDSVRERLRHRLDPKGMPDRPRDYVAPLLNLAIGFLTSPRYAVKRLQGAITRSFHIMQGAGKVREFARDARLAQAQGRGLAFVRGQFRYLRWRSAAQAKRAVALARAHKGRNLLRMFSRTSPADIARNKGMLGFFRDARAAGASPLRAIWRGFTRTVETGGQMPSVAKQAAELGGRWGKALTWTGRIGRIAPLLNLPLAVFDVREAWNAWRHPNATSQDKVSKTGQAALTSAAAGLAIAGFLTPPPLNAALLTASGAMGIASTVWGIATSEVAVHAFKKVGGFFSGLGRRLGIG